MIPDTAIAKSLGSRGSSLNFRSAVNSITHSAFTAPIAFAVLSIAITLGFFLEGQRANVSSLSGDQVNILTICIGLDNPQLLQGDLVVGDVNNVQYYIPGFIGILRVLSRPDHNYLRGLNILLLITGLIYMWGWWFLFSTWGDQWAASILAFLVRGIMWPPGNELWGIAGLWSMLPRTLFLALIPWMLWVWFRKRQSEKFWILICLGLGLIGNVHPISGLAIIAAVLAAEFTWGLLESKGIKLSARRVIVGGLVATLGLSPFIITYLKVLKGMEGADPLLLNAAVRMRFRAVLFSPLLYVSHWAQPKWLLLLFGPWIVWLLLRKKLSQYRRHVLALGAFELTCIAVALTPFLVEDVLKALGHNSLFAFQIVRTGKYVLIPSIILGSLLVVTGFNSLVALLPQGRTIKVIILVLVLGLTAVSRNAIFNHVPILGDDVVRFLWPSRSSQTIDDSKQEIASEFRMDRTLGWIKANTSENAKFVGPRSIRVGALRPVVHDFAAAGLLLEGNPKGFIAAAEREKQLREKTDLVEKGRLIAGWGADYWVTRAFEPRLRLIHSDEGWFIYDLRTLETMNQGRGSDD